MELSIQAAWIAVLHSYFMRVLGLHLWIPKKHRKITKIHVTRPKTKKEILIV